MISSAIVVCATAFVCFPVSAFVLYVRIRRITSRLGALIEPFNRGVRYQFVGVLLSSPVLVALILLRRFDVLTMIAIAGTGVLGFTIAVNDLLCLKITGIHEHGLVWNGTWLFYTSVDSMTRSDAFTLSVVLKDRSTKLIALTDSDLLDRIEARIAGYAR